MGWWKAIKWLPREAREKHLQGALVEMGSSVVTGITFTKLVGVTILARAPSQLFRLYYFRECVYVLVYGMGAAAGLFMVPSRNLPISTDTFIYPPFQHPTCRHLPRNYCHGRFPWAGTATSAPGHLWAPRVRGCRLSFPPLVQLVGVVGEVKVFFFRLCYK